MNKARGLIRTALYRLGVLGGMHRVRNRKALTVLMFHRVLPSNDPALVAADREFTFSLEGFARTLDFVQRHYSVISLEQLKLASGGIAPLPSCPLLITFDDGWRDTLLHAAPELKRRGLSGVLFLATEVVDQPDPRWWQDALVQVLGIPGAAQELQEAVKPVTSGAESLPQRLTACFSQMSSEQRWALLSRWLPESCKESPCSRQMLDMQELMERDTSVIDVGGHGHTHSPLTLSPKPLDELGRALAITLQLQHGPISMSFPHGCFNAELVRLARQLGYELIFTSEPVLERLGDSGKFTEFHLGRVHLPENEWTCSGGRIDFGKLAAFLFFRPIRSGKWG